MSFVGVGVLDLKQKLSLRSPHFLRVTLQLSLCHCQKEDTISRRVVPSLYQYQWLYWGGEDQMQNLRGLKMDLAKKPTKLKPKIRCSARAVPSLCQHR